MSKHNYSQYSNKKKPDNAVRAVVNTEKDTEIKSLNKVASANTTTEVKMEAELVKETVNTVTLPKTVEGVVVNCAKLNVRAEPNVEGEVVCVLDVMSEIKIDTTKSDNEWFKVHTATGIDGYCMRKFVDARL